MVPTVDEFLTAGVEGRRKRGHGTMTPREPWRAGRYEVVALGILEDLAGNPIGRAFEIVGKDDKGDDHAAVTSILFSLGR